jgi:phage-related protein
MSDYVGTAAIQLRADDKQLTSDLNQAGSKTKTIMSGVGKAIGITAAAIKTKAIVEATGTVAVLTKKSAQLYAAFEQSVGGTETLFKDAADNVLANADRAFEKAGISANTYLEQVNSLAGALMQSTGENAAEAAQLADRAMQSISDNSAKIGTDIQMLQNAYQSFARGQFMLLDNLKLGYGGTKGEMERLIADASEMTEEMAKLGVTVEKDNMSFGNMVNAIAVVQEHMGIAGTTINEAYSTISGSMKMAKAAAEDFVRGLADPNADIGALFDKMMTGVTAFSKNIGKTLVRLLPNITKGIKMILDELAQALPGLITQIVPILSDTILDIAVLLLNNAPAILDALWKGVLYIVMSIAQKLPEIIGAITKAIMSIATVLTQPDNLRLMIDAFQQLLVGVITAIPAFITELVKALPTIIKAIIDFFLDPQTWGLLAWGFLQCLSALVNAIPQIFGALVEAFGDLFSRVWEKLKSTFTSFAANFGKSIGNIMIGAVNAVIGFIESTLNGPINAINGMLDAINSIPGVNISKLNNVTLGRIEYLATGGVVNRATPAIIGEAGAEAVIPLERDNGWAKAIAGQLASAFETEDIGGGRTINIYMNNTIDSKLNIDEISQELVTSIRRAI